MMWISHELRVRYQETDKMGVVYHANYLNWFEVGRTEMIRHSGVSYRSIEERGVLLPLISTELKFLQPARYDDQITVYTRISEITHVRLNFDYEIKREEQLLVSGTTRHVWVNRDWKPVRMDRDAPELYDLFQKFIIENE